jgi:hypothetical protein
VLYGIALFAALAILTTFALTSATTTTNAAPSSYPTWVDREVMVSGTVNGILVTRCTYHQADGTTRVAQIVGNLPCGAAP